MNIARLTMLAILVTTPVIAQPIIIPLEPQPKKDAPPPVASAPPVAPPTAAPNQPETAIVRGEPDPQSSTHQEEAYQPPEKQK